MRIERTRQIVKDQPDAELRRIGEKILNNERILSGEGILLFEKALLLDFWVHWQITNANHCMATKLISTGIFILNPLMSVCSPVPSVLIPDCTRIAMKAGNSVLVK